MRVEPAVVIPVPILEQRIGGDEPVGRSLRVARENRPEHRIGAEVAGGGKMPFEPIRFDCFVVVNENEPLPHCRVQAAVAGVRDVARADGNDLDRKSEVAIGK